MTVVNFFVSRLRRLEFKLRLQTQPQFSLCFTNNITSQFYDEMDGTDNMVAWIYGRTGSGKSSVGISLADRKDKSQGGFTAKNIVFDNLGIKSTVAKSEKGHSFVRDETVRDFGEGSKQLLNTIQDLTETLRKRRNSFFLLSPVIKGVAFVHYYLEVLQSSVSLEENAIKEAIESGLKVIHFRVGVQNNLGTYLGYIVVEVPVDNPIWLDYQKLKDDFLEMMASGERQSGLDIVGEAKRFRDEIDLEKYVRKGERLNFIKMNSNYTLGQCKSIAIEMERVIREDELNGKITKQNRMETITKPFIPFGLS